MWNVLSPDRRLELSINQDPAGRLYYQITQDGETVVQPSRLGLCVEGCDLDGGLLFQSSGSREIRERYALPAGKKAVYQNDANEICLAFQKKEFRLLVRCRAMDDGAAFRYELEGPAGASIAVLREHTDLCLPESCRSQWLQRWNESYETPYDAAMWDERLRGAIFGMPALFSIGEGRHWVLATEANVYNQQGNYCASHLKGAGGRRFTVEFAPDQNGPVSACLPLKTPWRAFVVTRDLNALTENTVPFNLNPPSRIEDTSWIKPSRNLWGWWFFDTGAQLLSEQIRYVDFAAAMGFESVTVDASWDATWVKELCSYARRRGVSIWIWTAMETIGTYEEAREKIALWASWGVAGLKVDFFISDSQHTMWQYQMITDLMTEHKLMINFHGCVRPGGEGRTYPNMLAFEGIMGLEHYKWSDMPCAAHNCTVPFTRNAVGPMDYTPLGFSNRNRNTTLAHQLALPVVFESGSTHYSESIYHLENWIGLDFLRRTKPVYEGMRLLAGYPGHHVAMLRYAQEEWFVGCLANPAQELCLPLDFLPEGELYAELYTDDPSGDTLLRQRRIVTRTETLRFTLRQGGGAALYFSKRPTDPPQGVRGGYMRPPLAVLRADELYAGPGCRLETGTDGLCHLFLGGGAAAALDFPRQDACTLRLCYASSGSSVLKLQAEGSPSVLASMPDSGGPLLFRTLDVALPAQAGSRLIALSPVSGQIRLRSVSLLDYAPHPAATYTAEQDGVLLGRARLAPSPRPDEPALAADLGRGGELRFETIEVGASGWYLVNLHYCSGATLPMKVEVNGQFVTETSLLDTSGEALPRWDVPSDKELRLYLAEGTNTIRFYHETSDMVLLQSVTVRREDEAFLSE